LILGSGAQQEGRHMTGVLQRITLAFWRRRQFAWRIFLLAA
jgi:hypothetical protein